MTENSLLHTSKIGGFAQMNFFWFFSRSVGNNNVNNGNDNKSEDFVHIYCWEAAKFRKMAPRRTPEDSAYAYISRFPTTHRDPSAWDSTGSRAERPGAIATRCKITDCPINRHISGLRSEQFRASIADATTTLRPAQAGFSGFPEVPVYWHPDVPG